MNLLSGKELSRVQELTPLREVIRYAALLSCNPIGIRAESVVNARFHGVKDDNEEWSQDEICTLLDFVHCEQANEIPENTLQSMKDRGEIAKVGILEWEK